MRRSFLLSFSLILAALSSTTAMAAACCGGGVGTPALITGDEKATLSLTTGQSKVHSDVAADGLWKDRQMSETSQRWILDGAHIFRDRWQAGLSLPVIERSRNGQESAGLGDVTVGVGYEYLPDWNYNPYRPKGTGYLQWTLPTGTSIYEAESPYQLDSRGRGFYSVGVGTLLSKAWGAFDALAHFNVHHSFERTIAGRTVDPGLGGSMMVSGGYSLSAFRLGSGLNFIYEDAVIVDGRGSPQRLVDAFLSLSYFGRGDWSATLTANDQTLFGSPVNTSLSRGFNLSVRKTFSR